jgi:hypothetical protein
MELLFLVSMMKCFGVIAVEEVVVEVVGVKLAYRRMGFVTVTIEAA